MKTNFPNMFMKNPGIAVENLPIAGRFNVDGPFNAPVFGTLATPNIIARGFLTGTGSW